MLTQEFRLDDQFTARALERDAALDQNDVSVVGPLPLRILTTFARGLGLAVDKENIANR